MSGVQETKKVDSNVSTKATGFAAALLGAVLGAGRAEGAIINDWTDPSLYSSAAPTDQMLYTNRADSTVGTQRVLGNGEVLSTVSLILGKGSVTGDLNAGSLDELKYGVWVGKPSDFDLTSAAFDTHFIKLFDAPTTLTSVGNVGGVDLFKATFAVVDANRILGIGEEELVAICPMSKLESPQTIALGMYADPGALAVGSLVDYQYMPVTGALPLDDPAADPGWHKFAMSAETVQVPEPGALLGLAAAGVVLGMRGRRSSK